LGDVAFGQGYACAADHLATLADQVVKVRSERASFFGRGDNDRHVNSDFGYLALGVRAWGQRMLDTQPAEIVELVEGYAAGVNRWLSEHGPGGLPEWCRDAAWIRPITSLDLFTLYADVALMASGRNVVELVGAAQPPGAEPVVGPPDDQPIIPADHPGSNGWAFGSAVTANGRGMVVANPHFPWRGDGRFWECHLTVPGQLDIYGVSLIGTPLVQMGFNRHVAWTHTFSAGHRFCFFQIHPADGPTNYRHGDTVRKMTSHTHHIEVLGESGTTEPLERTLWRTHHGPMLDVPFLGWTDAGGFALGDANDGNDRFLGQYLAMDRAASVDELRDAVREHQGLPWTNTIAADDRGEVWYADASTTPRLSAAAGERFVRAVDDDLVTALLFSQRVALLDGSDPDNDWVPVDAARQPGRCPIDELPELRTDTVAFNSNDPYWVPHPELRLDPAPALCGLYGRPLSPRTRMNATILAGKAPSGPSEAGWTPADAERALLDNASLMAELLLDDVLARAEDAGEVRVDGQDVPIDDAVRVLSRWDRRFDLDSVGAIIWREFLGSFSDADLRGGGVLWAEPFDVADPIATPRGLHAAPADGPDPILVALGRAVVVLDTAGLSLNAPLGDVQFVERGGRRVALHGANEVEGIANVVAPMGAFSRSDLEPVEADELPAVPGRTERTGIRQGGYPVTYGASFVAVISFGDLGPVGRGLLVYGQCGDSRSPHHVDQVEAFSAKALRPLLFTDDDIAADPELRVLNVEG